MNTFFMHKIKFNNKVLDRYQTKAVLCRKKSYLVVAGAGTGKTFTIASKINLGGKAIIIAMSIPIISALLELIIRILP